MKSNTLAALAFALAPSLIYAVEAQPTPIIVNIDTLFTPSGWMGDGEYGRKYLEFDGAVTTITHTPPAAIRFIYSAGPTRWAGVYWQNEPDNWGDKPGQNLSDRKVARLSFWARGETGNEVVEFKSGGIDSRGKKFRDSYSASTGRVRLTREWSEFTIDLTGASLSSVIGAFACIVSADYNPSKRVVFYVDDVRFEQGR